MGFLFKCLTKFTQYSVLILYVYKIHQKYCDCDVSRKGQETIRLQYKVVGDHKCLKYCLLYIVFTFLLLLQTIINKNFPICRF